MSVLKLWPLQVRFSFLLLGTCSELAGAYKLVRELVWMRTQPCQQNKAQAFQIFWHWQMVE